jgi:PAS domain S-box-containing protein
MSEWQLRELRKLTEFGEKVVRYEEDGDFILLSMDDDFCKMLGYGRAELFITTRNRAKELIYPPDLEVISTKVRRDLKEKGCYAANFRMKRKNGELIWVWETGQIEDGINGTRQIRNLVVNVNDAELLRKQRDTTYDNIPGGVVHVLITKTNFYVLSANRRYFEMLGTSPDEYLGSSGMYTFPEDRQKLKEALVRCAGCREPVDHEFRCYRGDTGEMRWFRLIGHFYELQEEGSEYLCILTDITQRQYDIFQLEKERERYRIAMRIIANFLFEYRLDTHKLSVYGDAKSSRYVPCVREGIYENWRQVMEENDLVYPDDRKKLFYLSQANTTTTVQVRLLASDKKRRKNSYQWYEIEGGPIREDGNIVSIIGSARHIAEKKREGKWQLELQNIYELQGNKTYETVLEIKTETEEMKGYFMDGTSFEDIYPSDKFDSYIELTAVNYIHPEDRERFIQSFQLPHMLDILQYSKSEEVLFFRARKPGEEYRYKCVRYSFLANDDDIVILSTQDMNEFYEAQLQEEAANRKILASAINEEQMLEEMRQNFLSMCSRELSTPLSYVEKGLRQDEASVSKESMHDAVMYMSNVLENISEYEQLGKEDVHFEEKRFALDDLIQNVLDGCEENGKKCQVPVRCHVDIKWKYYYGDAMRIAQLVGNIIGNSIMASPSNDCVEVWADDMDQGEESSVFHMIVEDYGVPVNDSFFGREYPVEDVRIESLWERSQSEYFTAFSLVVAKRLTELLSGQIRLTRKKDYINVIEVILPLKKSQKASEPIGVEFKKDEGGQELRDYSLLLIESENTQEKLNGPLLRLHGAWVETASGGKEAMELWLNYPPKRFDAVLLDGNLADMDFLEFTEWFRKQDTREKKQIPIIVLAGGVRQDVLQTSMLSGVNVIMPKTIDIKRLKNVLDMLTGAIWNK